MGCQDHPSQWPLRTRTVPTVSRGRPSVDTECRAGAARDTSPAASVTQGPPRRVSLRLDTGRPGPGGRARGPGYSRLVTSQ